MDREDQEGEESEDQEGEEREEEGRAPRCEPRGRRKFVLNATSRSRPPALRGVLYAGTTVIQYSRPGWTRLSLASPVPVCTRRSRLHA